jgi:gamma-glutamylcyclotransferase (GGCT)/AIG2-like uncharacterized protein YtfP
LYFAYGSNLSLAQMRVRCPEAIPVAAQDLPGYRLAFVGERTARWGRGGVATVVPQAGVSVHGALYRLSREDELALDGFEGVATGRYRKDILRIAGHSEPTLVYLANASLDAENMPNAKYLAVIRQGFADWGLPPEVLSGLSGYPAEEKT